MQLDTVFVPFHFAPFSALSLLYCHVSFLLSSKFIDVVLLLHVPGSSEFSKDINTSASCSLLHFVNTSWRHCYPEYFLSIAPFLFAYAEPEPVSLHSYASLFAMTSVLQHCLAAGTIKGWVLALLSTGSLPKQSQILFEMIFGYFLWGFWRQWAITETDFCEFCEE